MNKINIDKLNLDEMLLRAEMTTGILQVIYALKEVDDYSKDDAAEQLLKLLDENELLTEINK